MSARPMLVILVLGLTTPFTFGAFTGDASLPRPDFIASDVSLQGGAAVYIAVGRVMFHSTPYQWQQYDVRYRQLRDGRALCSGTRGAGTPNHNKATFELLSRADDQPAHLSWQPTPHADPNVSHQQQQGTTPEACQQLLLLAVYHLSVAIARAGQGNQHAAPALQVGARQWMEAAGNGQELWVERTLSGTHYDAMPREEQHTPADPSHHPATGLQWLSGSRAATTEQPGMHFSAARTIEVFNVSADPQPLKRGATMLLRVSHVKSRILMEGGLPYLSSLQEVVRTRRDIPGQQDAFVTSMMYKSLLLALSASEVQHDQRVAEELHNFYVDDLIAAEEIMATSPGGAVHLGTTNSSKDAKDTQDPSADLTLLLLQARSAAQALAADNNLSGSRMLVARQMQASIPSSPPHATPPPPNTS
ncbi:hypothetical protein HaLaN_31564, partial [Haematococcus lacustris]